MCFLTFTTSEANSNLLLVLSAAVNDVEACNGLSVHESSYEVLHGNPCSEP